MNVKKLVRTTAMAGVTLVAMGTTPLAHAESLSGTGNAVAYAAGCPGDGHLTRNHTCTSLSSGALFHQKYTNDKASTSYKKTGGSSISARLGFNRAGTTKWSSWFSQGGGTTKSYSWSGVTYCSSTVGLLEVKGQQTYQTPLANCTS
ncbi:hypothetical protein [Streptomyces sp. WZ-12]|uniref:hypothetical protein n=1 Tax=Streptomyces sp. WZ-12 TaxID=3030210 RepID=UPI002380E07F|nr:hypothetical protein [Streptomyces sp. WZ-12]